MQNKKPRIKINPDGTTTFEFPFIKPRNPNLPKGSQRHEDKRNKRKHKNKELDDV